MASTTQNITPSLVDDPHHNLEKWTESVETIARSMCAMHDVTGALTLVISDVDHAGNATAAAVNIHRMAATRHNNFSFASSSLTTILLASLGEAYEDTLRTTFPDLAPYMLDPRQIVDTMLAKHGVATASF
jgi:hypothetical protein